MIDLLRPFRSLFLMAAGMFEGKSNYNYKELKTKESIEYHIRKAQEKRQHRSEKIKKIKQANLDEINVQK